MFRHGSRVRLKPETKRHFTGETLFDRVARVLCDAECLPRKELYESWEIARRARRRFRGGRVIDLACGHGLVAHLMLMLDDSSPNAIAIDTRIPKSAPIMAKALTDAWPRLANRITYVEQPIEAFTIEPGDVLISTHACGALTDRVLDLAIAARARVAVMPCCHDDETCDAGDLEGWVDAPLAIDVTRARRLAAAGFDVHTQKIPEAITPKNRVLFGSPTCR